MLVRPALTFIIPPVIIPLHYLFVRPHVRLNLTHKLPKLLEYLIITIRGVLLPTLILVISKILDLSSSICHLGRAYRLRRTCEVTAQIADGFQIPVVTGSGDRSEYVARRWNAVYDGQPQVLNSV
ncbi:hypothetical protein ES702_03037 [subsurface metagenome]